MIRSLMLLRATVVVFTLILTACGPGTLLGPTPHDTPASCVVPGWTFGGPCTSLVLGSTGGSASLPAYQNISVSVSLGLGTQGNGQVIALQDAIGNGDITGTENGKAFPPLTGAFLYLGANNTGGTFTSFSTPGIVINDTSGLPGKSCTLYVLNSSLTGWSSTPLQGTVSGNTLTFAAITDPAGQSFPAGNQYFGFVCK
jgi:hypothetical protein